MLEKAGISRLALQTWRALLLEALAPLGAWRCGVTVPNIRTEQTEARALRGNHRRCFDHEVLDRPSVPTADSQTHSSRSSSYQLSPFHRPLKNAGLVAKGEHLGLQHRSAPELD
jgi:hypothetical protein